MRTSHGLIVVTLAVGAGATSTLLGCKPSPPVASDASVVGVGGGSAATTAPPAGVDVVWVAGSTKKVCQLTQDQDKEIGAPTINRTAMGVGLGGTDLGYSFEHNGKLFFLFGDSNPTPMFRGMPNLKRDFPRTQDADDAIAWTTDTTPGCPHLEFLKNPNGSFKNPEVLGPDGRRAITLRINEVPSAGFSEGGKMFVVFGTDNPIFEEGGPDKARNVLGYGTRSILAESTDDGQTFRMLYDFSKGSPAGKFVNVATARGTEARLFWGTQGGSMYRKSPVYFARKPFTANIETPAGMEYLTGLGADGKPQFSASEADAAPLFRDVDQSGNTKDCASELGVEWNKYLKRWVMLYNCPDDSPSAPKGIRMRTALEPWGPWGPPQTIFNAQRDGALCHWIHRAVTPAEPQCDNLSLPNRMGEQGGAYGPYFISRFTTGDEARGISTIYYTISTWNPYTPVVMQTTLQRAPTGQ